MSADATPRSSSLLFDEQVLVLRVRLATLLTLPKAIVFQQLRYCTQGVGTGRDRDTRGDEHGRVWIGRTVTEWRLSSFPFWCNDTIADTFAALVEDGYVLEGTFPEGGKGRTKWYAIADDALMRLDYLAMAQHLRRPTPAARPGRRDERAAALAASPLPRDELFIDSETLFILPKLAKEIGLNEAIVLQQVYYWLDDRRKPEVRDGERWIYNTYADWQEQFPFFSTRTVQRTFLNLERKGLLKSSHFSRHPDACAVDHTKWYTIDFAAVRALRSAGQGARSTGEEGGAVAARGRAVTAPAPPEMNVPLFPQRTRHASELMVAFDDARFPDANAPLSHTGGATFPPLSVPDLPIESANIPAHTFRETTETKSEIAKTKQEQRHSREQSASERCPESTVVVPDPTTLSDWLFARGVTRKIADRLARDIPADIVRRQIEVYDWLREVNEDDERLTPGRLRLMIEEEWVPPRGFVSAAERARRTDAAREAEAARQRQLAAEAERARALREQAAAEQQSSLHALGLLADDQRVWASITASPCRLPSIFADALFYPPQGAPDHTPPVVIFRDQEACDRARGPAYAADRREIERRLIARYPALAPRIHNDVRYLVYADLLMLRQADGDQAGGATSNGPAPPL